MSQDKAPRRALGRGLDALLPAPPPPPGAGPERSAFICPVEKVVPQAGHGVLGLACLRDAVFRFIDAEGDDEALRVDADCARALPRPPAFIPVAAGPAVEAAK